MLVILRKRRCFIKFEVEPRIYSAIPKPRNFASLVSQSPAHVRTTVGRVNIGRLESPKNPRRGNHGIARVIANGGVLAVGSDLRRRYKRPCVTIRVSNKCFGAKIIFSWLLDNPVTSFAGLFEHFLVSAKISNLTHPALIHWSLLINADPRESPALV